MMQSSSRFLLLWGSRCCLICFLSLTLFSAAGEAAEDVVVRVRNDSGDVVSVHWINPKTKEPLLLSQIPPNQTSQLNSFYNHQFQIHQEPDEKTGLCGADSASEEGNGECKINYFAVEHRPQQCEYFLFLLLPHQSLEIIKNIVRSMVQL